MTCTHGGRPCDRPHYAQPQSEDWADVARGLFTLILLCAAGYALMIVAAAYFPVQP